MCKNFDFIVKLYYTLINLILLHGTIRKGAQTRIHPLGVHRYIMFVTQVYSIKPQLPPPSYL